MVGQLMNFVSVPEREAIELLRQANWSVQAAAEKFLTESRAAAVDSGAVDSWFNSYNPEAGPEGHAGMDAIDAEAVMQFCSDIGVDAESDVIVLAIAWKMDAEVMGTFSRKEFQKGMAALGAENAVALKEKLPALRAEIADPFSFKKMYSFCFKFARVRAFQSGGRRRIFWSFPLSVSCFVVPNTVCRLTSISAFNVSPFSFLPDTNNLKRTGP
jgi:hypothetical protein